jgi:seryl-tRNA synthetase
LTDEISELKVDKKELETSLETANTEKQTLSEEVGRLTTQLDEVNGLLATAKEVIGKFEAEEAKRAKLERDNLVLTATEMRADKKLPEKDYENVSLEVIKADIELMLSLPEEKSLGQHASDSGADSQAELKEDMRQLIFGYRKDGKTKKITNLSDVM